MPKEYLVPKSICDYSLQEVYYLDEEAVAKERANGSEVLYYMGEEIPMFRFSGVTVTVEWMRGMIGAAILTGAVGALLGTGIAEILEKGGKRADSMNEKLKFCKLLGTNINVITMNETVDYMDQHLDELRGKYICVSNVHTTVMAFRDAEYRKVQNGSAMNLPDGKPLSIVCRMRGHQEAGRVPGPDLMPRIFELSEKKGYRHYFLWQYGKYTACAGTETA